MNRREFLAKLGISTVVLATIRPDNLEEPVSKGEKLQLDQSMTDNKSTTHFIKIEVGGMIHKIPVYTMS